MTSGDGVLFFWEIGMQYGIFSHQKGAITLGRRLFQILLAGSRTPIILLYYPIKSKIITSNKLNMSFKSVPILVLG